MKQNIKWLGWVTVVIGSFLPLVRIPLLGTWNFWKLDHRLAFICWGLCGITLLGILLKKDMLVKIMAIALIFFFTFTIFAVKIKAMDTFHFVPVKSWQKGLAGTVKLRWGWFVEFAGALVLFFAPKEKKNQVTEESSDLENE